MSAKRALVVDDSRSARAFLTRMLERHDLAVDAAASAEEALNYLADRRPDVIFMDHLMPGMDGFQALQAIKTNPLTATIPVMMYTSQEGELYLSQARALGAIGVLPKQIQPTDVTRALEQLKLLGVDVNASTAEVHAAELRAIEARAAAARAAEARNESVTADPVDLRRYISQQMESQMGRVVSEMRQLMNERAGTPEGEAAAAVPGSTPRGRSPLLMVASIVGVLLLATLGWLWARANSQNEELQQQLAVVQADLGAAKLALAQQAQAAAETVLPGAPGAEPNGLSLPVPFGELPLAGNRVERLQTLLTRLMTQGFHGVVQIHAFAGRYCLINGPGGSDTPIVAPDELLASKCDSLGNPMGDPVAAAQRESVAFANMLAAMKKLAGENIELQVGGGGADEGAHAYPEQGETATAGEWNRVANANNRVEVRWRPRDGAPHDGVHDGAARDGAARDGTPRP